ncbi:putative transporter (transmembrane protein) [Acinetobacter calcoaceticus]|uniref:Small-conductance mechanosensitive channel n=1 Tax=Acinetobacter calcoaceticus TaxID=471 RepID=A0A4R1Y1F9_ACICA|nr:putative transporter (transmembrane protein) [Acinetobacter calcoaceticus]
MNDYVSPEFTGKFDFMYYWDQFQPIIAAVAILIIGWILALIIAAGIRKILRKLNINHKLSNAAGHAVAEEPSPNYETILAKFVFWFIMIIVVVAALNILNISSVSAPLSSMIGQFLSFVPNLIAAVIIGFIAWVIARLVRAGLSKTLAKTQLDEKLSSEAGVSAISSNIADIVYWLILLLFLPIILSILGLTGLLLPVQGMLNEAIAFIPNLFMAGVILFVGYILAKIVRGIVEGLCNSLNLQQSAEKIGLFKNSSLARFFGSFVFALIIITALIVAFEALGVRAISDPATAMLYEIMNAIPQIIAATLILILAYVVSRFVARLLTELVAGTGVDQIPAKLEVQSYLGQTKISQVMGYLIVFFTMLFAVSEAANRLGLHQISELIAMFIQFGASILLGAVILVIGFWLANIVANVVQRGEYSCSKCLATLVRVLIMGLVIAMGLKAMGIADSIVNLAFGLTLGAVAVAFAVAFGLGGRQPAERLLTDLMDRAKNQDPLAKDSPKSESSTVTPTAGEFHTPSSAVDLGPNDPDKNDTDIQSPPKNDLN